MILASASPDRKRAKFGRVGMFARAWFWKTLTAAYILSPNLKTVAFTVADFKMAANRKFTTTENDILSLGGT